MYAYIVDEPKPQSMKTLAFFSALLISSLSFSQSTLSGAWFASDSDVDTPLGFDFQTDGDLKMYKVDPNSDEVYSVITGSYYYEDGSNLLVTITWFGTEAKTSKYTYEFENGNLVLKQTYPENINMVYERESNVAGL